MKIDYVDMALDILEFEEGYRAKAYHCSEKYVTIGIGQKLCNKKGQSLEPFKDMYMPKLVARAWLETHVLELVDQLDDYDWFHFLNDGRKAIIISVCYQVGLAGFLKFKKCISAMDEEDFGKAAEELLDSKAARQTPKRWNRNAQVMATGNYYLCY